MKFDVKRIEERLQNDSEFRRETRYCGATLKLIMGDEVICMIFHDGNLACVTDNLPAETSADVVFEGTDEIWEHMLATYPIPWYQCIESTAAHHGLKATTNVLTHAYLPAWNRLVKILRQINNE